MKTIQTILISVLCLVGIILIQNNQIKNINPNQNNLYEQEDTLAKLTLKSQKNLPNLGFANLWADWNYLKFIQYYGDPLARKATGYDLIPQFFKIIVDNDPRFIRAMMVLSPANSLSAASPQITVDLLNQVLQKISPQVDPLTPFIWSYKGIDEMLFLGQNKAAQHSHEMAAKWALKTTDPNRQFVAQRNQATADFLARNPNSKKARVMAWTLILSEAINEDTQATAIKQIKGLGGKVSFDSAGKIKIDFPEKD